MKNVGYEIIMESQFHESAMYTESVVLGMRDDESYVTWIMITWHEEDNHKTSFEHGHYTSTLRSALDDYYERVLHYMELEKKINSFA